jgi:hypothetical protein
VPCAAAAGSITAKKADPALHCTSMRRASSRCARGVETGKPPSQVKSRITLRDTWSKRQAGAMRPVRRAGWVWAASCFPASKAARAGCRCAGASHMDFSHILCCGDPRNREWESAYAPRLRTCTQPTPLFCFSAGAPLAVNTQTALRGLPSLPMLGACFMIFRVLALDLS